MSAEPYCLAMVLCDNVHRDKTTGKFTILGTFSTLGSNEYPAKGQFFIYFAVTDGIGRTQLKIRLVDAELGISPDQESGVTVFEIESEVDFHSPLIVFESAIGVEAILPKEGLYHCELVAGTETLMSRRLLAVKGRTGEF